MEDPCATGGSLQQANEFKDKKNNEDKDSFGGDLSSIDIAPIADDLQKGGQFSEFLQDDSV